RLLRHAGNLRDFAFREEQVTERFRFGRYDATGEQFSLALGALIEAGGEARFDGVDNGEWRPRAFRRFRKRLTSGRACLQSRLHLIRGESDVAGFPNLASSGLRGRESDRAVEER